VIEDRVLEFYGQNISTQTSSNVDSQAPDVAQLELAAVLGEEQLEKVRKVTVIAALWLSFNSWSVVRLFFITLHHIILQYCSCQILCNTAYQLKRLKNRIVKKRKQKRREVK
jgi:hypothetical protein